jgi:pilus assembly protein Flp/PilA
MQPMRAMIRSFLADTSGATAIEYGIIAAVISLAIIAGVGHAHNAISEMYIRLGNTVANTN